MVRRRERKNLITASATKSRRLKVQACHSYASRHNGIIEWLGNRRLCGELSTRLEVEKCDSFNAGFRDVHCFDVTIGGAHLAPSTIYGYAKAASCPFTMATLIGFWR
jgi:hypothetical protein